MTTHWQKYEHVKFKPWIGKNYGAKSRWGMPILVLGESQYQWDPTIPMDENTTIFCIETSPGHEFRKKVVSVFLGRDPLEHELMDFWNSVAFYNYVQTCVGLGAKNRPTRAMFQASISAFLEVVAKLQPKYVLALGATLWKVMPGPRHTKGKEGPDIVLGSETRESYCYPTGPTDYALACPINHPSMRGLWSVDAWHPWVISGMEAARRLSAKH